LTNEVAYFQGKGKWARLVRPDDKYNKWNVQLYLNAESLEKLRELQAEGVKNPIKKDDDGYFANFSRPVNKLMAGKVVAFTPPKVVDKDGIPYDKQIGNNSDLTVKCEVYQHKTPTGGKAKAIRLESVRIDNLIPFEQEKDFNDDEKAQVAGLKDQPEQLF